MKEQTVIEIELSETVAYRLQAESEADVSILQQQIGAQQKQIEQQNEIISRQQAELNALKELTNPRNPAMETSKPQN
jgi:hypothetical protein